MAVQTGDIPLSANFNVAVAKPIDPKYTVDDFADLANIPFPYAGLTTRVTNDATTYVLQEDLTTWLPSGGGDTDITKTLFVSANGFSGTPEKGNLSKPYQTIEDALNAAASDELVYVYPSTYTITSRVTVTNVNMYCLPNVVINDAIGLFQATTDGSTIVMRGKANVVLSGPEHFCEANANNALFDIEANLIELQNHTRQGSIFRQNNFAGDQLGNRFILRNTKVRRFTGFFPTTMILVQDSDVSIFNCDVRTFGTRFMDIRSADLQTSTIIIKDSIILDDSTTCDGVLWFGSFSPVNPPLYDVHIDNSTVGQPLQANAPFRYVMNVDESTDVTFRGDPVMVNENVGIIEAVRDDDFPVKVIGTLYSNQDITVTGVVGTYTIEVGNFVIDSLVSPLPIPT